MMPVVTSGLYIFVYFVIQSINLEKKQLFQQWNSSLIGMRRRDEAHSAMQEALKYVVMS